ncbi:hypothetical protein [Escherichia albertii]|uniref:hypothetical protein n=1 Tax=Escherichia albertii TaxID=208962 RepID=UPI0013DDAE3B|nr:hypothetical protein [Escherichia albertii]
MQTITIINSIVKIYIRMIIKGKQSKRPPPEEVAFQNAPYKGGECHIPFSTLATPSAVHVFVPSFPDASHIV